ncbi:MAG: hypothetical protein ACI8TX_000811 [Hyphomicrobiaceae bacterium]|jgi:hypothetical protein
MADAVLPPHRPRPTQVPTLVSALVTSLGWLAIAVGGVSVPWRAAGAWDALRLEMSPGGAQALAAAAASIDHPVQSFLVGHLGFITTLYVVIAAAMLTAGIGLIRRRAWALTVGAVVVVVSAARQLAGLSIALSSTASVAVGMPNEESAILAPWLIGLYSSSLVFLIAVTIAMRRPSVLREFPNQGTATHATEPLDD